MGYNDLIDKKGALAAGIAGYLEKSLRGEVLENIFNLPLAGKHQQGEAGIGLAA